MHITLNQEHMNRLYAAGWYRQGGHWAKKNNDETCWIKPEDNTLVLGFKDCFHHMLEFCLDAGIEIPGYRVEKVQA